MIDWNALYIKQIERWWQTSMLSRHFTDWLDGLAAWTEWGDISPKKNAGNVTKYQNSWFWGQNQPSTYTWGHVICGGKKVRNKLIKKGTRHLHLFNHFLKVTSCCTVFCAVQNISIVWSIAYQLCTTFINFAL